MYNFKCECCGSDFTRPEQRNYKFCSAACYRGKPVAQKKIVRKPRNRGRSAEWKVERVCRHCERQFMPGSPNQVLFCSKECRSNMMMDVARSYPEGAYWIATSKCEHCGCNFQYRARKKTRKYCSNFCKTMG